MATIMQVNNDRPGIDPVCHYLNYYAVVGISIEMANCPPNAFAIRSSVATEGFAIPLSILEMSD